ncbi:MAG: hypothetical protein HYX52_03080 [Chloroflexi bacterium]|nr:hypothetical protein [Chloroflexota bacterium]
MIFVDYLGPAALYQQARGAVAACVATALRSPVDQVSVRRIVTEDGGGDAEVWIELSTEEQLYRVGEGLAKSIHEALSVAFAGGQVWVMYRIVPRSHAFLNGSPRHRGTAGFE